MSERIITRVNELLSDMHCRMYDLHSAVLEATSGKECDFNGVCVGKTYNKNDLVFRVRGHCRVLTLEAKFKDEDDDKYVTIHQMCDY